MDYNEIFQQILDEHNFTVGGGSTCALVGAMACGLIGMVVNLSRKKDYGYSVEQYEQMLQELDEIKIQLLRGSVQDHKAYLKIVNAYKFPKLTDEEKQVRKLEIQNAGIEAAKVPLLNACLNQRILDIGMGLLNKSNPSCLTDLQAGIELSKAGILIGKENVKTNLPLIKDEKIKKELELKLEKLKI